MESQDEFQFKPINEGLGFHKKKPVINLDFDENMSHQELSTQPGINRTQFDSQYQQGSSLHGTFQQKDKEIPYITDPGIQFDSEIDKNAFDETQSMMTYQGDIFSSHLQPEPSKKTTQVSNAKTTDVMPNAAINSFSQKHHLSQQQHADQQASYSNLSQSIHPNTHFNSTYQADLNSPKEMLSHKMAENIASHQKVQNLAPHFGAWLLDLFVIIGLVHICVVPLLFITELSVSYILTGIQTDFALQISLGILFLSVLNFYLITTRNFFGATLGEWSFDIAVGDLKKRQSSVYPILVAWRCLLMNITGIITLPFLGLITRTDILGKLTSVRLTRSL